MIGLGSLLTLGTYHVVKHNIEIPDIGQGAAVARMSCCFIACVSWARASIVTPQSVARHLAILSFMPIALVLVAWFRIAVFYYRLLMAC